MFSQLATIKFVIFQLFSQDKCDLIITVTRDLIPFHNFYFVLNILNKFLVTVRAINSHMQIYGFDYF